MELQNDGAIITLKTVFPPSKWNVKYVQLFTEEELQKVRVLHILQFLNKRSGAFAVRYRKKLLYLQC